MPDLEVMLGKKAETVYWTPPRKWEGQTVFVIGGGPSLLHFDVKRLETHNCISVNNAHLIAPWSEYLVFHDKRWLEWHLATVVEFRGEVVTTNTQDMPVLAHRMRKDRNIAINCTDSNCIAGIDSGTMALNLAFHLGAATIALVGFDMGFMAVDRCNLEAEDMLKLQTPLKRLGYDLPVTRALDSSVLKHWHQEHPIPPREANYKRFLKQYADIVKALRSYRVNLVTLTPSNVPVKKVSLSALAN